MDTTRYGEVSQTPFRSPRLCFKNGRWYFNSREGEQVGPFYNQTEVKMAIAYFIAQKLLSVGTCRGCLKNPLYGVQDGIEHMLDELLDYSLFRSKFGKNAALAWTRQRLKELMNNKSDVINKEERIKVLEYATDQEY